IGRGKEAGRVGGRVPGRALSAPQGGQSRALPRELLARVCLDGKGLPTFPWSVQYQERRPAPDHGCRDEREQRGNNQETKMQIKFHHVNLCTRDVPGLDTFYRDVLDMKTEPGLAGNRDKEQGYAGNVSFLTDGRADATQFHLAEQDMKIGFKTG